MTTFQADRAETRYIDEDSARLAVSRRPRSRANKRDNQMTERKTNR